MEEAKVTFYKIEKCGLYEYGADVSKLGNVAGFLSQLKYWVKKNDKPLDETCTYAIEESEDVDRTFCYDLIANGMTGDFLLTTWNETRSEEHTSELQSRGHLVCRLLLEKKHTSLK